MVNVKNVGTAERVIRVIGGALATLAGVVMLLPSPGSISTGVAGAVLVVLGLDFVFTGARGYCPLYHRLGWSTHREAGGPPPSVIGQPKP